MYHPPRKHTLIEQHKVLLVFYVLMALVPYKFLSILCVFTLNILPNVEQTLGYLCCIASGPVMFYYLILSLYIISGNSQTKKTCERYKNKHLNTFVCNLLLNLFENDFSSGDMVFLLSSLEVIGCTLYYRKNLFVRRS